MEVFKAYLLQNWTLILILIAFVIMLLITVFLDKKTINRMYVVIAALFVLSIFVFTEFYLADLKQRPDVRKWMMAIRYSATPIIIAMILYTLVKKAKLYVFLPAMLLAALFKRKPKKEKEEKVENLEVPKEDKKEDSTETK